MTLHWQEVPGAPAPGTTICGLEDLEPERQLSLQLGDFPVLLFQTDAGPRAFVNMCPHQFLPLDHRGPLQRSADGLRVLCSNHDAAFDLATGAGLAGLGLGCGLSTIPLQVESHHVKIAQKP